MWTEPPHRERKGGSDVTAAINRFDWGRYFLLFTHPRIKTQLHRPKSRAVATHSHCRSSKEAVKAGSDPVSRRFVKHFSSDTPNHTPAQKKEHANNPSSPGADKARNLSRIKTQVRAASQNGADLIVLPECFNSPYGCQYFPTYAETLLPSPPTAVHSPSFHALAAHAQETKTYLLGGSIPEYAPSSKKYYNTSLLFGPDGRLLTTHRKVHLFDIDIPGKITFRESDVLSPGNKITLVEIPPYGKIALAICYDIRFPELATIAARKGCFLLLYPGAFNLTTGPLHWALLARARAVDNQLYVALCSPARDVEATYHAYGHSLVVDPDAKVLVEAGEGEEIVYAELQETAIEETRRGIPLETQRRFDVYPDISEGDVRYEE